MPYDLLTPGTLDIHRRRGSRGSLHPRTRELVAGTCIFRKRRPRPAARPSAALFARDHQLTQLLVSQLRTNSTHR